MLESGIEVLIVQATEIEMSLLGLDERLDAVWDIAAGEARVQLSEKDQFWAHLGTSNRRTFLLDKSLHVLEAINEHRRFASGHVSSIRWELQAMGASLEHLCSLASSSLLYGVGTPLGLIMRQIKAGVEQLNVQGCGGDC